MSNTRVAKIIALTIILSLLLTPLSYAEVRTPTVTDGPTDTATKGASPRLIVELASLPLAAAYTSAVSAAAVNGKLDASTPAAQAYINQLQAEQAAFVSNMRSALSDASVATFINETGVAEEATYQIVFNGLAIHPGATPREEALQTLAKLPGVKNVYYDTPHSTQLYTSTTLINAPVLWNAVGGRTNAGAGVKVASMDGGVHHLAPMMNGAGYSYPPGYGPNGLGLTANNNGKIIASRAYFRTWDPPSAGDENPWPGVAGTPHGMHTSSTAAGGVVTATMAGLNLGTISGVAPKAYVMSYRVFYASVNGNGSFYTTEGLAALEDIVRDRADVVNNSWGEGPITEGGLFDPIDAALINANRAGIFVSMSAGNSGPGAGTVDHPSADYISVAASTTGGTLAAGRVSAPDQANLQNIAYSTASFGASFPLGQVQTVDFLPSSVVDAGNITGCNAWSANAFLGKAALISRGGCEFGVKVLNAQQAGAISAVVYNNAGDGLINMGPGAVGNQVTIPSIFIGQTNGVALVTLYTTVGAAAARLRIDTTAFQAGNTPDQIINFSSRGPGVGNVLKPDIAAPGVNIVAQGYTPGATGEARHLGYGQVSGTSMAAPHVAGAAALLKQLHPNWSNAAIKSALMSTAKYLNVYNFDGTPAQPLDMGAGRLDLTHAANPGVILDPPSLSFGTVPTGTQEVISVTVTSVATATESYALSTLYTGDGFTATTTLPGFTASPATLTLAPGQAATVQITFNAGQSAGYGDNQGYVLVTGSTHKAHLPAWARVTYAQPLADVLIIDNDFSDGNQPYNYLWYYTSTLQTLGYTYNVINVDDSIGEATTIPVATTLSAYKAIIHFTGDNFQPAGTFSVNTGLSQLDQDRLVEYLNGGGSLLAMGQDLSGALGADTLNAPVGNRNFYYVYRLGANWIQDSISNNNTPTDPILAAPKAPQIFNDVVVDLSKPRKYVAAGKLSGANEVPAVTTNTTGEFAVQYDVDQRRLDFSVTIMPTTTTPITVTAAHIHRAPAGVNGGVLFDLDLDATLPAFVTDTLTLAGSVTLTGTQVISLLTQGFYINVHTSVNGSGEIRGQIEPLARHNQRFVDEIDTVFHDASQDPNPDNTTSESNLGSKPLLYYSGPLNAYHGTVAVSHRDQPSLERPGTDYAGRSIYTTFGLEGVSSDFNATLNITPTSRSALLQQLLDWTWSQPPTTVQISDTVAISSSLHFFDVQAAYGVQQRNTTAMTPAPVQYRWDFGDGSAYVISQGSIASHQYLCDADNNHTLRVEITDNYGNVVIGSKALNVTNSCTTNVGPASMIYLPVVSKPK